MKFDSAEDLEAYVGEELRKGLPEGWVARRIDGGGEPESRWRIEPADGGSPPVLDYELIVSGDRRVFLVTHGNTDAGAFTIRKVLLNAAAFLAEDLDHFPLSELIVEIVGKESTPPNAWGLT